MSVCWLCRGNTPYVSGSRKKGPERGERREEGGGGGMCVCMLAVRGNTPYVSGSRKKGPERGERREEGGGYVCVLAGPWYHAIRTWE